MHKHSYLVLKRRASLRYLFRCECGSRISINKRIFWSGNARVEDVWES